jgi:aspartate racemase
VAAGAECVVVTSIAGHFCIDEFKVSSPLPVVDLISEVNRAIEQRGLKRIGILGTRTAMETRFYGGVPSAQIIPPNGQDLDDIHQAYWRRLAL